MKIDQINKLDGGSIDLMCKHEDRVFHIILSPTDALALADEIYNKVTKIR